MSIIESARRAPSIEAGSSGGNIRLLENLDCRASGLVLDQSSGIDSASLFLSAALDVVVDGKIFDSSSAARLPDMLNVILLADSDGNG